jgi:hypothetical protein
MSARRVVPFVLVAIAAAAIAVFGFFYFRDNLGTHYPIKVIEARIFRAGQIPWWNFYDDGGQPLAGNPNALTFYPDNVLYLFLPPHVAFNLHFLLHLGLAWFAMRALCRQIGASQRAARFAATMYAFSGLAISATAFYTLITPVALIPFALWAVERWRNPFVLGAALGLVGLVGEPIVVLSTAICAVILAIGRLNLRRILIVIGAIAIAVVIVSPQMIAYAEIAKEVERARGFSAVTTLNASLLPRRIAEIAIGPILGFLTDPGHPEFRGRLFSTIFLGIIVIPAVIMAVLRRYALRYLIVAGAMLFFALGRYNPIVKAIVEAMPSARIARYPEKFSIALTVALVVIVAMFIDRLDTRWRWAWGVITFLPLAACLVRGAPIDWFAPYRIAPMPPLRICGNEHIEYGTRPAREEFRKAARTLSPIFGAVVGVRYAVNRSPEGMHSLMSRIVAERAGATPQPVRLRYLRMAGCAVDGALPPAWIVPRVVGIHSVNEEVALVESGRFDEHAAAMAPANLADFVSPPSARVTRYAEDVQDITVSVSTPAPALLLINQSFFRAWSAQSDGRELTTVPLNIDRLGVVVPAGDHVVTLRFGRHRAAVVTGWIASTLLLLAGLFALLVEVRDRRAGEIERAADQNVAVG